MTQNKLLRAFALSTLAAMLAMPDAYAQAKVVATHCKADERVIFSCPFKHGKTASLCASSDLTKTTGTLQYRYGEVGKKPELMFPDLEDRTVERNHPKNWFDWSSVHDSPLRNGRGVVSHANTQWSTANVPPGDRVDISLSFSPIEENASIHFVIQAEAGRRANFQGSKLIIFETGGSQGRPIPSLLCIKEKTTEDLFSLKDIIQK